LKLYARYEKIQAKRKEKKGVKPGANPTASDQVQKEIKKKVKQAMSINKSKAPNSNRSSGSSKNKSSKSSSRKVDSAFMARRNSHQASSQFSVIQKPASMMSKRDKYRPTKVNKNRKQTSSFMHFNQRAPSLSFKDRPHSTRSANT